MRRITDDDPYYADELHKQFLSVDSVYFLTGEEQKWLSEHGAIKIGYLINDGGVSTLDTETGKVSGLIIDYIQLAQNCLEGQTLKFYIKWYDSQEDMQKALHDGEIDMIFHVMQNTNAAEDLGYDLTDTVWKYNMAAATVKNSFDENAENTVAIPREDSDLKSYVSYNYPQWHVKEYATWKDAKKAVYNGQADCMIMDSGKLEQYSDFCLNGRTVIQAICGDTALSHVKKLFLICQIPFLCLLHNFRIMFQKFCCSCDPQFEICIIQFFSGMRNFQCCQIPLKQGYTISSRLNRNFFLSAGQLYNPIDLSGNQAFCCLSDGNCIVPFLFRLFHGLNG